MRIAGSLWSVPAAAQVHALSTAIDDGLTVAHWDATDGVFAAAGGFTPESASRLLRQVPPVESEAHLMMHDVLPQIPQWARFCSTIVVPIEIAQAAAAVELIASLGVQPAVAISLPTDLDRIPADVPALLMSVTPGQAGSPFHNGVVGRVAKLHAADHSRLLGVDGGISPAQFAGLAGAGARWIVSGTSLFSAPAISAWIAECLQAFGER